MTRTDTQDRKPDFFDIPPDDDFFFYAPPENATEAKPPTVDELRCSISEIESRHRERRAGQ